MGPRLPDQAGDLAVRGNQGIVVQINVGHAAVARELAGFRVVNGQVGPRIAADPDTTVLVLVHPAREGGGLRVDGAEVQKRVQAGIEAEEVPGVRGPDVEAARAAHQRGGRVVGSRYLGDELPERAGFRVDLQDEQVVGLLSHGDVHAGAALTVPAGMEPDPVDGAYRDADIADPGTRGAGPAE